MGRIGRLTAQHALAIVEAGYSLDGTDHEWIGRVLDAAVPDLDQGFGVYGFTGRVHGHTLELGPAYAERGLDPRWSAQVERFNRTADGSFFDVLAHTAVLAGGFVQNSTQTSGRAIQASPRVRGIWMRVGLHLAAAMRLRRHLSQAHVPCDAILAPSGVVLHADAELRGESTARAKLARAVRDVERARTAAERRNPERALELWRGLVAGRWSLVDHWEAASRRYVAAYRNQPDMRDPRRLTPREQLVLPYAALGASNKEIAFALGLSSLSVGATIGRLIGKLRCRRRSDLIAFAHPHRAEELVLKVADGEIGVLSVAHAVRSPLVSRLSCAEREIAERVVDGQSSAAIARARGTSPRTIANQLCSIFDKLRVRGRAELVRLLTEGPSD